MTAEERSLYVLYHFFFFLRVSAADLKLLSVTFVFKFNFNEIIS